MRKLLILKAFIIFLVGIVLIPASRNFLIRKTSEKLLSTNYFKVEIEDLQSNHKEIKVKNTHIIMKGNVIAILDDINIKFSLRNIWRKGALDIAIDITDKGTIFNEKAGIVAHIDFLAKSFKHKEFSLNIKEISSPLLKRLSMGDLEGKCLVSWEENDLFVKECKIKDNISDFFIGIEGEFDGDSPRTLSLSGNIKEPPEDLHKELHKLLPKNELLDYLDESISGSLIKNGSWTINLPKEFWDSFEVKPEYISGKFDIESLDYKYDEDFPALKKINANLDMKGTKLTFKLNSAMSHDTKLSDGKIFIDWANLDDTDVVVDAKSSGPTADLTDYIPPKTMNELKESDIDLSKFTGSAKGDVHIVIPANTKPNSYDIKVKINKASIGIFDGNVIMSNASLDGIFDGKAVKISGKGLVNGFKSDIQFVNYLEDTSPVDNMLKLKVSLENRHLKDRIPFYNIDKGQTVMDILYKDKGGKRYFSAKSDLSKVALNISKLGIYSEAGKKAFLHIEGENKEADGPLPLIISIKGDGLEIEGTTSLSSKITEIHFPKIISNDTKFTTDVQVKPRLVMASIHGKFIDLSESSMIGFLTKDASGTASDIKVKFDAVKLKKDIYLDDFSLNIECGKDNCSKGEMHANIGTRKIDMQLHPHKDYEEWRVSATNAGAILKGFGIIDNIKAGDLSIIVKTNIKKAERGKIIPIAEGEFKMEKFVTVDNKFLTRLVSNLSLPGLMNIITNSNDISFREMTSKFDYVNNVINIYEGSATGAYMDLTIKGRIDTENKQVQIKGRVTPSLYGVNSIANRIPIIGRIFGGKGKASILSAPYSFEDEY